MRWEFKQITAEDVEILPRFFNLRSNKTCDSVFLDSFLWKDYYHVEYCVCDDKAVEWKMTVKNEQFAAIPLCKEEDLPYYFFDTKKYFNEVLGQKLAIYLADEEAVRILDLDPSEFSVTEQVDAADYLYDGESMRTLAGKKYHKKKNHVNGFRKEYEGRYEYRTLCCSDRNDMWKFLDRWRSMKGTQLEGTLDPEVEGIHSILNHCSDLGVRMGGVYVDGQMEAFTMGSYNQVEDMAIIHIEKANPDIRGLYAFINQQFLVHEFPDVTLVNREDDVGLPGLRKAKQSYNPIGFVKKFQIREL
ncbi:DUF2156 domain-containing protein [Qiania dongpingensis]|uniref:DUF2156 domain-containing protein n=1 Tax=Qiania dongpingensis TaxID=2763669 RepID=A0A7G9G0N1_9FIRM|nr:phosphatidylglycerol lysyltransferase domain-containing protein [Qiania dongpingensis]QNM04363.1 DUF2156 domain-containing protein [Qiania dongpingensis]